MAKDIKRLYFYAPAVRFVYIHSPAGDRKAGDEGLVAQLKLVYARDDGAAFFEKLTIMTARETFKEKR